MKDSDLSPEEVKQVFQALWIGFEVEKMWRVCKLARVFIV